MRPEPEKPRPMTAEEIDVSAERFVWAVLGNAVEQEGNRDDAFALRSLSRYLRARRSLAE
jgi:hypothetical protein